MNKKKLLDFVERVGATFLNAFLGVVVASHFTGHLSDLNALEAAAVAGGLAAAKFAYKESALFQAGK